MGILGGFSGFGRMNVFTRNRFEDFINRRGWIDVFWETATRCACYSLNTGNPDPNCTTCIGVGFTWKEELGVDVFQEPLEITSDDQDTYFLKGSLDGIECDTISPRTLVGIPVVVNITTNVTYTVTVVSNTQIILSGGVLPKRCDQVFADYTYLRDAGVLRAIITGVDYQRDYIPASEWLNGDAVMTVSGQYKMGFRDRITIPEQVVRGSEMERRFDLDVKGRSLERLRYKSGIKIIRVRDRTQDFTEGVDFELGPDKTFVWLAGLRPKHKAFNLIYTGDATSATLAVTATELTVTLVGQTDGSQDLSLSFASFPTVQKISTEIESQDGYNSGTDKESDLSGVDNGELNTRSVLIAGADIKNVSVIVENEDRTQYAVEYMHHLAYTIFTKQGMPRRHDGGVVLPQKHWLRLWEHTDRFSNAG